MINITIISSCLASIYASILYNLLDGSQCISTQPQLNSILHIILGGVLQPSLVLTFLLLAYRNVNQSKRRVGRVTVAQAPRLQNQFIVMIFSLVLVTGFLLLHGLIMYMYYAFTADYIGTVEQSAIISFGYTLTNYCYYLING
ncbi:unnamed protein product [Rotaria socialis]|uniref:G-protein coupled receptors family 1 profile domain-containing protein n=1 Tax=Rotaria socialis TaxID=392032 RepID=A0A821FEL3_9BILA|nr:unnamed protein product [Rotaria socialis]